MAKQLLGKEVVAALNERIIAKAEALKQTVLHRHLELYV